MKAAKGFTLIEVMVAAVIVAILAAIALPSYQSYLRKGKRAVAQSFVAQLALKEEEYFAHARAYTTTIGSGGLGLSEPTETNGYYTYQICTADCLSLPSVPSGGYLVVAVPVSGSDQARDSAESVVLYSSGTKCATGVADRNWGNATC